MRRHHRLPFGAETTPAGTRFRVWAPRAAAVAVAIDGAAGAPIAMTRGADGVFEVTTTRARAGSRYRYLVDGKAYPDPASRHQPDGVHGASEVVDPEAFDWPDAAWRGRPWPEIVLYELHVGSFSPRGDFAGVVPLLDHVAGLGATAVELMPVADFPGARNWGYDGVALYAPARCYGRPEDLKALVAACHERGLAVFIDVVYNHFGPEGNYLPAVSPEFFTERHHTPWGAAIAYDGPNRRAVRDFVIHNALYWLDEFHCDGLRLDAVHAIADDSGPDILSELAATVRRALPGRHIHLVLENDRNEAGRLRPPASGPDGYDAQWNDDLHHALHTMITGDAGGYYADFAGQPAAHLGRALAEGFAFQGEESPYRDGERRGETTGRLAPTAFVAFMQNHDQVGNHAFGLRISARAPAALRHIAAAIVLLAPQIPLIFMGEEWASARPFAFFCDFEPALAQAVRDGRRREFARFPEFADEALLERIPDATAPETFAMSRLDWDEAGQGEHREWLDRYRALLDIRRREIVPRLPGIGAGSGRYGVLAPRAVRVEWRLGDGSTLLLLANFAEAPAAAGAVGAGARVLYVVGDGVSGHDLAPRSAAFLLLPPA